MYPIGGIFTDIHRFYENNKTCCVTIAAGIFGFCFAPLLERLGQNLIHSLNDFKPEHEVEIESSFKVDTLYIRIAKLFKKNDQDTDILSLSAIRHFKDHIETLLIEQEEHIEETTVQDRNSPLFLAINEFEDHIKTLLIEQEGHIEEPTSQGGNALLLAIKHIKNQTKAILIEEDQMKKTTSQDGNIRLLLAINKFKKAITNCKKQIETLLIEQENQIAEAFHRNRNIPPRLFPIISNIMEYHDAIINLFIETGANLEATDQDGNTPLLLALRKGNDKIAKLLIYHGANIQVENNMGESPCSLSRESNHSGTIRLLQGCF